MTEAGDPEATAVKIPFVLVHGRVASPSPCLHSRESHSHSIALQHQDIIKQRAAVKQEAFFILIKKTRGSSAPVFVATPES